MKGLSKAQKEQLWPLIEDYADAHAQRYWEDDQGTGKDVDKARAEDTRTRQALQKKMGIPLT